jgi:hypothetical protein
MSNNRRTRNLKEVENKKIEEMRRQRDPRLVHYTGIHGTLKPEIVPVYDKKMDETLIQGTTNATIVLGRDRPSGIASGYSGKSTSCAAIDITAGRVSSEPIAKVLERDVSVSNNFEEDASRIYLSEFTDLDDNFKIPQFKIQNLSSKSEYSDDYAKASAGIGIKSDSIRIIGRKDIKIVTKHLSSLEDDQLLGGISLIAGYDVPTELHPMVRGNNLKEYCETMYSALQNIFAIIDELFKAQTKINIDFATHKHMINLENNITDSKLSRENTMTLTQDLIENTQSKLLTLNAMIAKDLIEFTTPTSKKYLNSKYNKVN